MTPNMPTVYFIRWGWVVEKRHTYTSGLVYMPDRTRIVSVELVGGVCTPRLPF